MTEFDASSDEIRSNVSRNYKMAVAHEEMNPRRRNTMEDCHRILCTLDDDETYSYFGVYDGHGGRQIVDFLEETLERNISRELKHPDDASVLERVTRAFLITDMQSRRLDITTSGSTAVVALLKRIAATSISHSVNRDSDDDNEGFYDHGDDDNPDDQEFDRILYVANVGDSRAVLVCEYPEDDAAMLAAAEEGDAENDSHANPDEEEEGEDYLNRRSLDTSSPSVRPAHGYYARRLTKDHKADDAEEQKRIQDAGGFVNRSRVLGILAVSRSFGDHGMKDFVTAVPHTSETLLSECGHCPFLILACDGVWDVFSDQEAADFLMELYKEANCEPFTDAAKLLVQEAIRKGSTDNVTAIVIFL